uniref:(northern house mosquito) hypothetical protein n=1 Tax=Culex pipiens TaxID=7175 RepID=A0A8D8FX68_CULPI
MPMFFSSSSLSFWNASLRFDGVRLVGVLASTSAGASSLTSSNFSATAGVASTSGATTAASVATAALSVSDMALEIVLPNDALDCWPLSKPQRANNTGSVPSHARTE